jgi:hypothetical protein
MNMIRKFVCINFFLIVIIPIFSITVTANQPPEAPIITGPTSGTVGKVYEYTFSAIDPDGHEVWFWIEWEAACSGCKWIGPFDSGEKVKMNYSWSSRGTYIIQATAKDIYDEEGPVGTLEVIMTKSKVSNLFLFNQFFNRFPKALPILRFIVGLLS